jgi:hypothetical protein
MPWPGCSSARLQTLSTAMRAHMARPRPALLRCCALALLALASFCAAPRAAAAAATASRSVPIPGSDKPATLIEPAGAGAGDRPLLLLLPGFRCDLPKEVLSAIYAAVPDARARATAASPEAQQALFTALSGPLGAVVAVLQAPRSAKQCKICPQAAAAAAAAPASWPNRAATIIGAATYIAATAAGTTTCRGAWDATDTCCADSPQPAGDVPFILGAIRTLLAAAPAASPRKVYAVGLSAGAFMALRLACDAPPGVLAGVVAYAGAGFADAARCKPAAPLPVLLVHGRKDLEVPWAGNGPAGAVRFPGAEATLAAWARADGCAPGAQPLRETRPAPGGGGNGTMIEVVRYADGCGASPVEGWWMREWGHAPPQGNEARAVFVAAMQRITGRGPGLLV